MVLKPHEDAYGQMMLDHLRDGSGYEIVEHDDGHLLGANRDRTNGVYIAVLEKGGR